MQSMGCFARAFALKTFNGIKHCGHLLWSEASMLHKDIYICCMKNRGILYVASSFVRGCGLKLFCFQLVFMGNMSSSMRGCGLKYGLCLPRRSHAGVILRARMWIEMARTASILRLVSRHPPCEDVDWNFQQLAILPCRLCHPPCEGALLIIFTSKAYEKTSVWVDSIIMLYTADIS